jgi:hypothetical protein
LDDEVSRDQFNDCRTDSDIAIGTYSNHLKTILLIWKQTL